MDQGEALELDIQGALGPLFRASIPGLTMPFQQVFCITTSLTPCNSLFNESLFEIGKAGGVLRTELALAKFPWRQIAQNSVLPLW